MRPQHRLHGRNDELANQDQSAEAEREQLEQVALERVAAGQDFRRHVYERSADQHGQEKAPHVCGQAQAEIVSIETERSVHRH